MTTSMTRARHRAAQRPITPLTMLASAASENAATVGRRTALVAASSGLIVSMMGAAPASASPTSSSALNSVDINALTTEARSALSTAPAVTVAADVAWTVEQSVLAVTPAPEPEPEPEPVRRAPAASRTAERVAVAERSDTTAAPAAADAEAEAPTAAAVEIPASAVGSSIIDIASRYVGVPYVSGGSTPDGFDCSGFTAYVFAQAGVTLPRTSGAQGQAGTVVSRDQAQPGDLIWTPGHIAIYAGGNTQIDAPRPGKTIQFREIWQSNPTFVRVG